MAGTPKRIQLPRLDTGSWRRTEEESVETRLTRAVSEVLGLPEAEIQLFDSFADLGGDHRSAMALRKACMTVGMAVKTKDILGCQTLAELQTRITPCARQSIDETAFDPVAVAPLRLQTLRRLRGSGGGSKKAHSRDSSMSVSTNASDTKNEVEEFLDAERLVSRSAVVKPRAGLLEGKLVALLTLTNVVVKEAGGSDVELVPQSQMFFAGTQVAAVRQALERSELCHDLPEVWVVLEAMPLTEAGDVDRRRLRTWAQNVNEDPYRQIMSMDTRETLQPPVSEMERSLQRLVGRALSLPQEQIGMNFTFAQLGGDELAAMQLVARAKLESIYLNTDETLRRNTLAQLASLASQRGGLAHKWSEESFERFALSPMQQLYFQTAMGGDAVRRAAGRDGGYRFNQSLLLRVKGNFTLDDVSAAVEAVVGHHSMLRARFSRAVGGWTQRILPDVEGSYQLRHHTVGTDQELEAVVDRTQRDIDIENGPVFAVDHFHTRDGQQMLFVIAHHLVIDLLSWRVVIQDIDELLENGSLLSQRSMPFQKWNDLQRDDVQSLEAARLPACPAAPGDYLYWGLQGAPNTYGDALEVGFSLSEELTALLQTACNQVFQTDSADIYLAALLLSFAQTFHDRPAPTVWNQEHGRQPWNADIDISETVGWFTTMCPVTQGVQSSDDFVEVLRRLKDNRRSGAAARDSRYFASKFFNLDAPDLFSNDWPLEIIFSYAGSLQQLERGNGVLEQLTIPGRTLASATSDIGPEVGRVALFEVSAMVNRGAATVKFLYNRYSRHQELIAAWIHNYEHCLLEAIGRLRYHAPELTLADVPHLDATYAGLARLNRDRVAALRLGSVRDMEAVYPATATQQSVLISQARTLAVGHLHAIFHLACPNGDAVNVERICGAWQHVVARHAALRSVFIDSVTATGLYDQVILRRSSPNMLFIDAHPGEDAIESMTNLPAVPNAPSQPQHRFTVCKAPTKTYVKLDISAALCDTISVQVLVADFGRAYATGKALPETTGLPYTGYLQFLQDVRGTESLGFWKAALEGTPPCLFPRLAMKHEKGRYESAHADLGIPAGDVVEFGRSNRVSPDAVVRLAWALVLRAFCGSSDVAFGFRTTGREAASRGPSLRGAVGSFANTVVCRLDLSPSRSLATMLRSVEDAYTACLPHQHVSVAEVHHALGLRGDEKLFNSLLSFAGEAGDLNGKFHAHSPPFELRSVSSFETSPYEVAVHARFCGGKLVVDIGSNVLLESQAEMLANTLGQAVRAVLGTPNGPVGGVELFTDRDYAQIVSWGNEAGVEHQVDTLHRLVEKSATRCPDAPAVCAGDGELTYRQLDQYSSTLAQHLIEQGVGPNVTVPVVLEKSLWAPVTMLAVMKAGGAFVPIDAEELGLLQPISEQLNAQIAVGCPSSATALRNLFETVVIVTPAFVEQFHLPAQPVKSLATFDDLACVFFTPASSKTVKGLAFTHAAMTTTTSAQGPAASIASTSRVLQLSSFNVDIALSEVFTTLVAGGCVCIPASSERVLDYAGVVQRMGVTWSYMTPLLSRKLNVDGLPTLKTVCFRTRSLDEDSWMPWASKKRVLFAYGAPDVCPLGISFLEVFGPQHLNRIGQPLAGGFWVVNPEDHRRLMPVGAIGELVVEGPTLGCDFSRGRVDLTHWNTADFNAGKKTRYFKTGHRVRYTEGGCMELVASKKEDLEISGKTIVLADVEQRLRGCLGQGIDVMVEAIAFKGSKSTPTLAAFVELGSLFDGSEDLTRLSGVTRERLFIAKKLVEKALRNTVPAYQLPQIFIPVRHLPVTSSLKVNRRQLQKRIHGLSREQMLSLSSVPNPDEVQAIGLNPLPLTQSEEHMRALWARVLGIDETAVGSADGFLRAGGDDILAAQLVAACRAEGIIIAVGDVLRNISLADLCRCMTVEETRSGPASRPTTSALDGGNAHIDPSIGEALVEQVLGPKVGVSRDQIQDVAEATALQTRYIESSMLRGRANIDYFVFNFSGSVNSKQLESACQRLVALHPILRTAFVPHSRKLYQVVLGSHVASYKRYLCPSWRLANLTEKTIKKDQGAPVAFSQPMTKFMLLDSGKQSTLLIRLSKAQYDDLSIALLVKDLKRLYEGTQGPPRRTSYAEFARCAQLANAHGAEDYWRTLLAGASVTPIVAHDKPHQLTTNVRTLRQHLPVGSLAHLGITFETVLKAAWAMVLASLSGSADVVFGEHVEGRQLRLRDGHSVSGVLGPAANTVPVRVRFPDAPLSPLELLQHVHAQRVAGLPFENMGFLALVEKCTAWPYWTRLSSVVQHQAEAAAVVAAAEPKLFHLGAAPARLHVLEPNARDAPDLLVRSLLLRGPADAAAAAAHRVELSLAFCENRVPVSFAEETLRMLCAAVGLLTSVNVLQPIVPAAAQYAALPRQIPLPQAAPAATAPAAPPSTPAVNADDTLAIQTAISDAWAAVLEPKTLGVPEAQRHNAAFFDLWGSLIPAAQLAAHLTRELPRLAVPGLDHTFVLSMEDIIDHPTMLKQFELVARKLRRDTNTTPLTATAGVTSPTAVAASWGKSLRRLTGTAPTPAGRSPAAPRTPASALALTALPPAVSPLTPAVALGPVGARSRASSASLPPGSARAGSSLDGALESMTEGSTCDEDDASAPRATPPTPVALLHHYPGTGGLKNMASPGFAGFDSEVVSPLSPVGGRKGFGEARRRASMFFGGGRKV